MNKKAFTLIELLVVITIIGILAVGAVSVFTTQLEWARDSTRINDLKIMETACHQIYNDTTEYPAISAFETDIEPYISKALVDPKSGKSTCWATDGDRSQICQWYYTVDDDSYGSINSVFKVWAHFEKLTNFERKAKIDWSETDWWVDNDFHNSLYELYAGQGWKDAIIVNTDVVY